jgi:membrane dipeptidase
VQKILASAAVLSLALTAPALAAKPPQSLAIHNAAIVLDTHFDTPANVARAGWDIMTRHNYEQDGTQVDYPRMIEGGVDGGFFVIFTGQGARGLDGNTAAMIAGLQRGLVIRDMVNKHPDQFTLVRTEAEARAAVASGKKFVFISIENSSPVAVNLAMMQTYKDLGATMMGPIHVLNNDLGDSSTDPKGPEFHGLSPLGRQWVKDANRLGILIDASHSSDEVFDQILELSTAPIILSHTGSKAIYNHPRNLDDARIKALAAKGGVIQINAFNGFMKDIPKIPEKDAAMAELIKSVGGNPRNVPDDKREAFNAGRKAIEAKWPTPKANLDDLMTHINHVVKLVGIDHVGLSGDFDGGGGIEGLEDITDYPALTDRMVRAGYSAEDMAKFWGGNALRVLTAAQAAAN